MSKTFDQASSDARSSRALTLQLLCQVVTRNVRAFPESTTPMDAFLLSTGIIFLAELGDKSQLMAMTLAARYRATTILAAITVATAVVHLFSVLAGAAVGAALPTDVVNIVAGLAFLVFAAWTIRGDELGDDDEARAAKAGRSVFWTVAAAFFLAELGDKTMLATVTLAADEDLLGTWIGSTVGMVAADALAIVVGQVLGRRLPQRTVEIGAAVAFVVFGLWLIAEGAGWL